MNNKEYSTSAEPVLKEMAHLTKTEVKVGYKKTKMGWIPEEWEIKLLGDFFEFKNGLNKGKEFFGFGTPIINYMDVNKKDSLKNEDITGKVSLTKNEIRRFNIRKGDVFFTRTSETIEEIAYSTVLLEDIKDGVFSGFVLRARPKNKDILNIDFTKYCFSTNLARQEIMSKSTFTTRALTNGRFLSEVNLLIPPLPEQQKIAQILTTWDKAIALQEKLIAKKQALKKGLMQELLTGKKRFPGFEGEWEEVSLEEVCDVKGKYGIGAAAVEFSNDLPRYLRITDIDDDGNYSPKKEVSVSDKNWSEYVLEEGDILFARTGNTTGKTYLYKKNDGVLVYAGFLIKFAPNPNILNSKFLKFYAQTKQYWNWVQTMSVRSGQPGINSNEYGKLKLLLPSIEEQQKIVAVLSNFDTIIENLNKYKNSLIQQKQGLMQQLLTGEKRVNV
jgi:type I restriction enzyme S subunit